MGIRYNKITDKHQREIVLLKSFPCKYGKCSFCNYIEDNSLDEEEIDNVNMEVLKEITGEYGVLEVINSGSVFELTQKTLEEIKRIVKEKNIKILYFEIYYGYIKRIEEIKKYFSGVEIRFRMGIETFDNNFRVKVYNKNFILEEKEIIEISKKLFSVCLLICVKGQTKEMIENDIKIALENFQGVTINIFINNGTVIERDNELVKWFIEKYSYLALDDRVEVLLDNKDLGVFEQ
ncbi:radical SAM protein [Fusobacterium varium]|uniref:radical SAM protein n=1 Tax=Fusobacterium varium TaxID=856 RepID=UPI000E416313|nr:radical SAM protein [Fusobacterium varium]MCI6033054.1 radical SAM protein [Fusobacterium varium]RGJ22864.1 radical SAM protein [Fusobacterium varium]